MNREIPVITVESIRAGFVLMAENYGRKEGAGFPPFSTREEAEKKAASVRLMLQGKQPTKSQIRHANPD